MVPSPELEFGCVPVGWTGSLSAAQRTDLTGSEKRSETWEKYRTKILGTSAGCVILLAARTQHVHQVTVLLRILLQLHQRSKTLFERHTVMPPACGTAGS